MTTLTRAATAPADMSPDEVHETIARHMLADGFDFVLDLHASRGSTIVDAQIGRASCRERV